MAKRRPSGDGMVRKRPDGRWEGRLVVGHKADGSSIFRYLYADNQKELTARLRQEIDAYQGIDLTEDSRMTLAEWLNRWLEQMAPTLRPGTLNHYRSDLAHHVVPYLGQKKLTQLTSADLRNLYNILKERGRVKPRPGQNPGLSPTTVHGIHATLTKPRLHLLKLWTMCPLLVLVPIIQQSSKQTVLYGLGATTIADS